MSFALSGLAIGTLLAGLTSSQSAAPTAPAAPASPAISAPAAHISVGVSPSATLLTASPASASATLSGIAASGAKWVRVDIPWFAVEAQPGAFDWSTTDRVIAAAAADGLKVLPILDYAPAWAIKNGQPDPASFGVFAGAAAARYPAVTDWEVWNEENEGWAWPSTQPGSVPSVSASAYGALLQAAYPAIHAAGANETVIVGGMAPAGDPAPLTISPQTYLSSLISAGFGSYMDAVGVHPYTANYCPGQVPASQSSGDGMTDLFAVHNILTNAGLNKPVWATELGTSTGGSNAQTPAQQAQCLATAWNMVASQSWIGGFFVYSWQDDSSQQYGLLTSAGAQKPAWTTFHQIAVS